MKRVTGYAELAVKMVVGCLALAQMVVELKAPSLMLAQILALVLAMMQGDS